MDMVSFRAMISTFLLQNVCTEDTCIKILKLENIHLADGFVYVV